MAPSSPIRCGSGRFQAMPHPFVCRGRAYRVWVENVPLPLSLSFAPPGLVRSPHSPRACALGCNLGPLRGWNPAVPFHCSFPLAFRKQGSHAHTDKAKPCWYLASISRKIINLSIPRSLIRRLSRALFPPVPNRRETSSQSEIKRRKCNASHGHSKG